MPSWIPFVPAFVIAVVLTPAARRAGVATGFVDRPTDRSLKIHRNPVPVLGGLAITASTFGALGLLGPWPSSSIGVAAAVTLSLVAGLVDDLKPVPAWIRILLQVTAGVVLVAGGLHVEAVGAFGAVALVLLVVTCSNAVNLMDGQDGLAAGLGGIAALGLAAVALADGRSSGAALGFALGGSLLGFLIWNRPPARIFLGNGGAYALGVLLAAITALSADGWRGLLAAAMCLMVFAFELAFTATRRLLSRAPLTRGDRLHSYDLLAATAGSRAKVTVAFCAFGLIAAAASLVVRRVSLSAATVLAAMIFAAAIVLGFRIWALRGGGSRRTS